MWRLGEPLAFDTDFIPGNWPEFVLPVKKELLAMGLTVCAPLPAKSGLVGVMVLEKKEKPYLENDLQIIGTLANHSALAIQSLRAQEELRESKELESFHKLSSFVVHDFRNILSIISMLAENAKIHMNDLEFRHDLTRTLADSAEKMRQTLSKISMKSRTVELSLEEISLDLVAEEAVTGIKMPPGIELVRSFDTGCRFLSDSRQLKKVIENLLLNACDSISETGKIKVTTFKKGPETVGPGPRVSAKRLLGILVSDTGCGMTEEFIKTKLFHPFQTTKRNGLGIGLYHCKEIVETLGGWIDVESEIDKGTTFQVNLPMTSTVSLEDAEPGNGVNPLKATVQA